MPYLLKSSYRKIKSAEGVIAAGLIIIILAVISMIGIITMGSVASTAAVVTATTGAAEDENTGGGSLVGNAALIYAYFSERGYSDYMIAGILGNMQQESGLKTNNVQNSYESSVGSDEEYTSAVDGGSRTFSLFCNDQAGYGLVQWTYKTLKADLHNICKTYKNVSIADLYGQLDTLYYQMSPTGRQECIDKYGYSPYEQMSGWSLFENSGSAGDACYLFHKYFEKSNDTVEMIQTRINNAESFYDQIVNGELGASSIAGMSEAIQWAIASIPYCVYSNAYPTLTSDGYIASCDCSALCWLIYQKCGCTAEKWYTGSMINYFDIIPQSELQVGDVLFYRPSASKMGHAMLYIGNGQCIECGGISGGIGTRSIPGNVVDTPFQYDNNYRCGRIKAQYMGGN